VKFTSLVDRTTRALGSPAALCSAIALVTLWCLGILVFGLTDTYQLIINTSTTIVTFIMVFVIQSEQNRSDKALHTKLDGVIAVLDTDDRLEGIENMTEKQIDKLHDMIVEERKAHAVQE
jgi:low affinity Fe/Cu permease